VWRDWRADWRAPVSEHDEYEHFRAGIERRLELAQKELDVDDLARLRFAVQSRHGEWLRFVGHKPLVKKHAESLIALLADADKELRPNQARDLEALVLERLPNP
jgi:hypothetical protein